MDKKKFAMGSLITATATVIGAAANFTNIVDWVEERKIAKNEQTSYVAETDINSVSEELTKPETEVVTEVDTTEELTETETTEEVTEPEITEEVTEVTTEPETETVTEPETEVVINTEEMQSMAFNGDTYSIRSLTEVVDYSNDGFRYQSYCIDLKANILYYIENKKICKSDIETGENSVVLDFDDGTSDYLKYMSLVYNQYSEIPYAMILYKQNLYLIDLNTSEQYSLEKYFRMNQTYFSFSSADKLCITDTYYNTYYSDTGTYTETSEWDFKKDTIKNGYIHTDYYNYNHPSATLLFMHDEDYYWLNSSDKGLFITYTLSSIRNDKKDSGEMYGYVSGIARALYDNEVYIMGEDYSVYHLDIEKLKEYGNMEESAEQDSENSIIPSVAESNDPNQALELIFDGSKIKQTGSNNLNEIYNFALTANGSIVVFDRFDNIYKIIESK